MYRFLLVTLVHIFVMPPLALFGTLVMLVAPRTEMVPRVARAWSRVALRAAGVRVTIHGRERLEATRPAVVVMNHTSAIDIYVACGYLPIPFRMVAKEQLFRIPIFGWALRVAGFVPLERSGGRADLRRLKGIRWDKRRRAVICFFPEGTRSRDGRLARFKRGAFAVALRERLPVLPVAIVGACKIQAARGWRIAPGEVEVRALPPLDGAVSGDADRDALCDAARALILEALPDDQRPAAELRP